MCWCSGVMMTDSSHGGDGSGGSRDRGTGGGGGGRPVVVLMW